MADTNYLKRVAEPAAVLKALGPGYAPRSMKLVWGGTFAFDAVSEDGKTVACVSTARNAKAGPKHKMKDDAFMLLNVVGATRRVMIFTHPTLYGYMVSQQECGRFPPADQIELKLVELPADIDAEVHATQDAASAEVTPR